MKRRIFPICLLLVSVLILWNCALADSAPVAFNNEQKISTGTARTGQPQIFYTNHNQGELYLAWLQSTGVGDSIFLRSSTDRGLNWSPSPIAISSEYAEISSFSDFQICGDNNGYLYVVWVDIRHRSTGEIYFNYSADDGRTWQEQDIHINTSTSGVSNPQISCNQGGGVYIAWVDSRITGKGIYYNYSPDHGKTWQTSDARLDSPRSKVNCLSPKMVCNGYNVYVAWIEQGSSSSSLYYNHSADNGQTWLPQDAQLTSGGSYSDLQCIRGSQNDNACFAWIQGGNRIYFKDTKGGDSTQLADSTASCQSLRLAGNFGGDVYMVWLDRRNGTYHVYERHLLSAQTSWNATTRIDGGFDTSECYDPSISCTSQGLVAVSWSQRRESSLGQNIFTNYSLNFGAIWQSAAINLKTNNPAAASSLYSNLCCSDTHGGDIYATWLDTNEYAVYGNYSINTDAKLEWTGETNFGADGVNPDNGTGGTNFQFRVKYTNSQNIGPATYQIWVDENDDEIYESNEKHDMIRENGQSYDLGYIYTASCPLRYNQNTDHKYRYRFYFMARNNNNVYDIAVGEPALDHSLGVIFVSPPTMAWAGTEGYTTDGVEPDVAGPSDERVFQVQAHFNFQCNNSQDTRVQVWIDANNNGVYDDSEREKFTMNRVLGSDIYEITIPSSDLAIPPLEFAGYGSFHYRFFAYDCSSFAVGDPTADKLMTVNAVPVLCCPIVDPNIVTDTSIGYGNGGRDFRFQVTYKDSDNEPPSDEKILWLDLNNDGKKQECEKFPLEEKDPNQQDYKKGKDYRTEDLPILFNPNIDPSTSQNNIAYQFFMDDANTPVGIVKVNRVGNVPELTYGNIPDSGNAGDYFTFQVIYKDLDGGDFPPVYQILVDENNDGVYDPLRAALYGPR